ncbi:MAG: glycoside hydrolase family 28 protein [Bacteroidales bacterium]|nr:glycoside hydrolase family 28 protein [Bacteroidales bacterium]MBR3540277.1 glycoside hydrolase family 28 protein [Bacteroidales bacterium]
MKRLLLPLLLFAQIASAQVTEQIPTAKEVGAKVCPAEIAPIGATFEGMPQLQRPAFPERTISIRKTKGNIQRAIDQLAKRGGGHVIVPAGDWKSGRITLRDNIDLHLEAGASIHFSDKVEDYQPAVFTRNEGVELYSLGALIYANGARNIAVTGAGFDADGKPLSRLIGPGKENDIYASRMDGLVVEDFINLNSPVEERIFDGTSLPRTVLGPKLLANDSLLQANEHAIFLPMFFAPVNCQNVLLEGVEFEEPLFWNITPVYCDSVSIRGCAVNSYGGRTDGIDIESTRNVLIEYCTLACGDDCFTLKAGRAEDGLRVGRPTENVVIRYCLAERGPGGVTFGSETAGMIRKVYMHDCVFTSPSNGFYFKSRRNRGGGGEDLTFRRIRMKSPGRAFYFDMLGSTFYVGELANRLPVRPITPLTPVFRRITMDQVLVESCKELILLKGLPESPVEDLTISHLEATTRDRDLKIQDALGLIMTDCNIK